MKTVPLTEAKDKLSALVDEADTTHEIIQITRHGRVAAVIMSADDLESLNETLHALRTRASPRSSSRPTPTTRPATPSAARRFASAMA
ncbi:antitoxin RelB [Mycobacterium xenopi 4042]|uniref:Antitoxin n=1 Tax=Mycobacterium xenopi 4042 TaxID=1299334 RepID=X8BGJ3_MYCXE|nr:antitoxin RelB [Mycobacterium xenopi 4042]